MMALSHSEEGHIVALNHSEEEDHIVALNHRIEASGNPALDSHSEELCHCASVRCAAA